MLVLDSFESSFTRPVAAGSGFEGVLFGRKWTFSRTFWEKVDFFACFLGESGPFRSLFGKKVNFLCDLSEKVDALACLLGES